MAQTGGAIAARMRTLSGGCATSPLRLASDRHVRLFALGNAGTVFGSAFDAQTRELAEKKGIPLTPLPIKTPFGVWADGAWSRLDFDDGGVGFAGDVWSGLAGLDYAVSDRFIVGLAGGYESQNFDTSLLGGAVDGSGLKLAPYAVYRLDEHLSLDASGAYTWLDYTSTFADSFAGSVDTTTSAGRWFTAADLNFDYPLAAWHLGGRVGALYAGSGVDDPFTADDAGAGQAAAVGDVRLGYTFDVLDGLEPYVSAAGHVARDDDAYGSLLVALGASLHIGGAQLQIQGSTSEATDAVPVYAGLVKLRIGM